MKTITKKEWVKMTTKNCDDSYSLVVQLAILLLWESDAVVRGVECEVLTDNLSGLSGAQAEMAINFATKHKPEWLIE